MRRKIRALASYTYDKIGTTKFFVATLVAFLINAIWLSFTAIYPLPFDEFAHVGAIQLYAKQWSWMVNYQPIDTGIIGDLTREPSFLYRWLMSFPYRVLDVFLSTNQTIIAMRLMNVVMVAVGIYLFWKLLSGWGVSRRLLNIIFLAFVMTPMVPFLAAHVNYDNLMFMLTPIVLGYATKLIKDNHNLVRNIALLVLWGGVTVLAKQTFLPIMAIVLMYVTTVVVRRNRGNNLQVIRDDWRGIPKNRYFWLIAVGLLIITAMSIERYGVNIVKFGTQSPSCEQIQPVELCRQFGPWYRNNVINVENRPITPPYGNAFSFSQYWTTRMMRGYFAIFQHTPTRVVHEREPFGPIVVRPLLPLPVSFAWIVAIAGLVAVIWQRRKIGSDANLRFALVVVVGFVLVQWLYNYSGYLTMWKAEAVQARYTYPIMILLFTLIATAVNQMIANKRVKVWLVVFMFVCYVWGGGVAGWLIRADDTWRWQDPVVQQVNHSVQDVLRRTVFN